MGFFRNLFSDMKARGLILPALLLVAAAIAAPFLLSTEPDQPVPPPQPEKSDKPAETVPWVIAGIETGSRDYQERLKQFKSKNPFVQQFELPEPTDGGGNGGGNNNNGGGGGGGDLPDPPDPVPPISPEMFVIDVDVGQVDGTIRERKNVPPFTVLPNDRRPVFAYIDSTTDGLQAVFSVSSEGEVLGEREFCAPSPEHCVYIVLSKGEAARVQYPAASDENPDPPVYRLKLRAIRSIPQVSTTTPTGI